MYVRKCIYIICRAAITVSTEIVTVCTVCIIKVKLGYSRAIV